MSGAARGIERRLRALLASACCLALIGCEVELATQYGRRAGPLAEDSVNGTAVLADMFTQAGHRVRSWHALSPRLHDADVIVWMPDRFEPPSHEVRDWLETWLLDQEGRTLIYVGRDYDAAPDYWAKIRPGAPPAQATEIARREASARLDFSSGRAALPKNEDCEWFRTEALAKPRAIEKLEGPWSDGIDPAKIEMELHSRVVPPESAEVLLASSKQEEILVSRQQWESPQGSQLIIVANGSFLLNMPLVDHEHRKLAGTLIDACGPRSHVVFLESGPEEPEILDEDPSFQMPTGMEMFAISPLNFVLLFLGILGIVFIFSRWPIFGLPKHLPAAAATDFGRHVASLGELLEKTNDHAYALARLRQFEHTLRSDRRRGKKSPSGRANHHRTPKPPSRPR